MSFRTPLLRGYEVGYRSAIIMLICTVVALLVLGTILIINNISQKEKKGESKLRYAIYACSGVIIAAGYIVFLVVSNI